MGGVALTALVLLASCTSRPAEKEIWIYTSLYKEVIAEMTPALTRAVPGVKVQWFQAGSENVASKLSAELAAGKTRADLVLTSDPFWYLELKRAGQLLPYESPAAKGVEARFRDPDHAFVTVRMPVMVIGYHGEAIAESEAPRAWKDLIDPKWRGKVSLGSPLESGSAFTAVAFLARAHGWNYFQTLRDHQAISAGSNSSVVTRIETRERPVGALLLENVLAARKRGSPIRAIYPSDGVIPVPSPIALLKGTEHPEEAKRVYDWFFSEEAQRLIVGGNMYPATPGGSTPEGAKAWTEFERTLQPWSPAILESILAERDAVKRKFAEVMLR